MQRTRFSASLVGALLLGASFGGVAAEPVGANTRSISIEYGDLELRNGPAVDRLYARLTAAAERVCGEYDARDLRARNEWRACYDAALAEAIARAQNPALAERHRSATRTPVG